MRQERPGRDYTLRAVARKLECQPAYLSMVERGTVAPPSEALIKKLAAVLETDPDVLLAWHRDGARRRRRS
jgi:transcriptional regulator with XRE-family HTH domain